MRGMREELGLDLPVILLTGDTEADRLHDARAGGYRLLYKPVSPRELRRAVFEEVSIGSEPRAAATDDHKHQF